MKFVFNHSREDPYFQAAMYRWTKGKLCYQNGYWDFAKKQLVEYGDDTLTCVRIDRDLDIADVPQADIDEVYTRLLNPIFAENKHNLEFFLKSCARIMAGHVEDKHWYVMLGERDSGKSVMVQAFLAAFESYVTTTTADHFLAKRGSGDAALDMKWAVNLDMARMVFTNEIKMADDNDCKIDGAMMKKIASGGDEIEARGLYEKQTKFALQCQFFLMLNDMPPTNTSDAMDNCHQFSMKTQFIHPSKREPKEYKEGDFTREYAADDGIKEYVKSDKCIRALTKILFDNYDTVKPKVPRDIKQNAMDNQSENDLEKFMQLFEFTGDYEDVLSLRDFNTIIKMRLPQVKSKVKNWMKRKGMVTKHVKNVRSYRGVRVLQQQNDKEVANELMGTYDNDDIDI
jgi:hypothetical protein